MAVVFIALVIVLFISVLAVGVYGYTTRHRKPSPTAAERAVVQNESPDAPS